VLAGMAICAFFSSIDVEAKERLTTMNYRLCFPSLETDSFFLPLALLFANTALPLTDAILDLNPCLFLRFL
jgi:hypothetical protein